MLPTVKIKKVVRVPYEVDEEPGQPTFVVTGSTISVSKIRPFIMKSSLEIDGRDADHDVLSGDKALLNDLDFMEAYFEALCADKTFTELFEIAGKEFYALYRKS